MARAWGMGTSMKMVSCGSARAYGGFLHEDRHEAFGSQLNRGEPGNSRSSDSYRKQPCKRCAGDLSVQPLRSGVNLRVGGGDGDWLYAGQQPECDDRERTEIEASVAAAAGAHVLHVQAWVADGSTCDTDVAITVLPAGLIPEVPTSAVSVSSIQSLGGWKGQHDTGGHGSSRGTMTMVNSPSMSGTARKFVTKYAHDGDERYSVTFGDDPNSTNFLYDAWVYFDKSSDLIGNLELDVNQVMPNGENAIFAFQCAGDSQTWDYTMNAGTPKHSRVKWLQSNQYCNPRTWSIDTWHHVQISYSRDDVGNVTVQSVWLDGLEQPINKTVPSAFALGWAVGKVQTQFQVDGIGKSGTTTVYVDNLTVYRW